jgi:prepilin-type N-terminal cleavage/methylation domain-containing protein
MQTRRGFTLIELLIVVGIVAVLAVTVIFTLNPAELLRQARDSNRLTDLNTLNKALAILDGETTSASLGTSTTVYVSIPDSSTTCANLGLPALPAGYSYGCAPTSTLRNTDGTGWIPVNFGFISSGSPLSALPIDPVNSTTTNEYYTYVPGGSWKLGAFLTSLKYSRGMATDGGSDPALLEKGTDLALGNFQRGLMGYWSFDDGSGTSATDGSGIGNMGVISNATWDSGANCKINSCLSFNNTNSGVVVANAGNFSHTLGHTMMAWVKPTSNDIYMSFNLPYMLSGKPTHSAKINGTQRSVSTGSATSGSWQFEVGTFDGTTLATYKNGSLVGNASFSGTDQFVSTGLCIGAHGTGNCTSNWYGGKIDEVRLYNRALSAAEIQAIYNATQ